jgi:hypothetical protein
MKKTLVTLTIAIAVVVGVIVLLHVADPLDMLRRLHGG